jgi:hypothetical protein
MSRYLVSMLALLVLASAASCRVRAQGPYLVYRSSAPFEDVLQALQLAIEEKGLYINNVMHMGEMLERTGKDLGMTRSLFLKAQSIELCSALLSRRMTAEDPARIVNCPYIISVYVLPAEPKTTYVAHRRVDLGDEGPVMQDVEQMLEALSKAAIAGF